MPLPSHCAEPGPLQDFCIIADLKSPLHVNGFPCKNPAHVTTSDDFFSDGLKEIKGSNLQFSQSEVILTQVNVLSFPGLQVQDGLLQ